MKIFNFLIHVIAIIPRYIIQRLAFMPQGRFYTGREPWCKTADHVPVSVVGAKAKTFDLVPDKRVVVFFHGNMACLASMLDSATYIAQLADANVVGVEYRGYGVYGYGKVRPDAGAIVRDACRVIDWLVVTHDVPLKDIVLVGHSVGTGIAAAVAAKYPGGVGGLVLISPYRSLISVVSPHLAKLLFAFDLLCTEAVLPRVAKKCPVRIVHGTADEVIPYAHGTYLANLAGVPLFELKDAMHNDSLNGANLLAVGECIKNI